jgi:lipid-binding SYLF domain-containing protein
MKNISNLIFALTLLLSGGTLFAAFPTDPAQTEEEEQIVRKANETIVKSMKALDNIMGDPENRIPSSLLNQSQGIVIMPGTFKMAFGMAGGQGGRGIAMIREKDGNWSNPFFVSLGEGSIGIQLGIQKSEIILLFKNKDDIMGLDGADITLGSDIGVAAGPVSKGSSSTSDLRFETEIYSYSRSNGLFAGVSLKGGVLKYNQRINDSLYHMNNVSPDVILHEMDAPVNSEVDDLIARLDMYEDEG